VTQGLWFALVVSAIVCLTGALFRTTQGTYEDTTYVAAYQGARPPILAFRGVSAWSLWYQMQHDLTPRAVRVWNLRLAMIASALAGAFAARLGLSGWLTAALLVTQPLAVETLASMAGRGELIAAIGVLLACVAVTWRSRWAMLPIAAGLVLALLGKESAIVGGVLVLLTCRLVYGPRWTAPLLAAIAGLAWACIWRRAAGEWPGVHVSSGAWLLTQAGAAFRLLVWAIVPIGQTMDADNDHLSRLWQAAAVVNLAAVVIVGAALWRTRPIVAFVCGWIGIVLLPRLIVHTPGSELPAHQLYLALPAIAIGWSALCQESSV
jgi:hypothetical protein